MSQDVISSLARYRLLGRSGLRVSPLTLGAGTFGQSWGPGWSVEEKVARQIFDRFLDAGGNVIDTANGYQGGQSEEWLGKFMAARGDRDRIVLATKFSFGTRPGDANGGGNGRKHVIEACEASLRRLKTDYIDLYWLHAWDTYTPPEEVMATCDQLVRDGKIRYFGFSNVPAWFLGRAQTLAELRGTERAIALQLEYSLVTREIEREFIPAAKAMGLGICPWSPLANGILTGKYRKAAEGGVAGDGRLGKGGFATGVNSDLREKNERIVDAVLAVAKELGKKPAQVAINWVTQRPEVDSTILGATRLDQLEENIRSLEFEIPAPLLAKLDAASALGTQYPYSFFEGDIHATINAGVTIDAR
jgi:aryl-alcohol dehydrogenase-like predicted oxidoreductase